MNIDPINRLKFEKEAGNEYNVTYAVGIALGKPNSNAALAKRLSLLY
jgi:hypothetical protein